MNVFSDIQDVQKDYISKRLRTFIIWFVVSAHVCLVVIPYLAMLLSSWLGPQKVLVSKVVLVDSEPNDNIIPSKYPGKNPNPPDEVPPPPGKLDDVPNLPQAPEPTPTPTPPEPQPQPEPQPETPQVTPTPPKPDQPVIQVPRTTPKKPAPATKKWTPIDPSKIKLTHVKPNGKTSPRRKSSNSSSNTAAKSLNDLANELRNGSGAGTGGGAPGGTIGGKGIAGGAGGPLGEYSPGVNDFYARVRSFLLSRWINRPSTNALGGATPSVRVNFSVDGSGRILSMNIHKCGIPVMDVSVEATLRNLRQLPAPPRGEAMSFYVDMRVED